MRHSLKATWVALALMLPLLAAGSRFALAEVERQRGECVVLLHGMWRSAVAMKPLQWYLEDLGYAVVNESYPSLSHSIVELADMAAGGGVEKCRQRGFDRLHFVTHSLGGILVRQYARGRTIAGLARVVMLGPPNQGSQVADYYSSVELLNPLRPQVMDDLRTGDESFMDRLGPVEFDLGVIAGTVNRRPAMPGFPAEIGDGTVSVAETIVPGMLDFLTMPTTHTFMIWNTDVMEQVAYFLERGQFNRGD